MAAQCGEGLSDGFVKRVGGHIEGMADIVEIMDDGAGANSSTKQFIMFRLLFA